MTFTFTELIFSETSPCEDSQSLNGSELNQSIDQSINSLIHVSMNESVNKSRYNKLG